jgi:SAM-dependent methyltransferase
MFDPFATQSRPWKYPIDNTHEQARNYHTALSDLLDPFTIRRLTGLMDLMEHRGGPHCLEVGAGAGSIAAWLAEQAGEGGYVLALDAEPCLIPSHPRLRVLRHDLSTDELPGGDWDIIHARLVLAHLPNQYKVLSQLATAVRPGGFVLIEDWDERVAEPVIDAGSQRAYDLYSRYQRILSGEIMRPPGMDVRWARRTHATLLREGLSPVGTREESANWNGKSAGMRVGMALTHILAEEFVSLGLFDEELIELRSVMDDTRTVARGYPLVSTVGWRA